MTIDDLDDFNLNNRQKMFCIYYTTDPDTFLNATQSWLKACKGKKKQPTEDSATAKASELMKNPEIIRCYKYILKSAQAEKDVFNSYKLLSTIDTCCNFNISDYLTDEGILKGNLSELGEMGKAIESVEPCFVDGEFYGLKVKFVKRDKFIEIMMKYLELIRPEDIQTNDSSIIYVNPMNSETGYEQMVVDFKNSQRPAK